MLYGPSADGGQGALPGGLLAPQGSPSFAAALSSLANIPSFTQQPIQPPSVSGPSPITMQDIVRALAGPAPSAASYTPVGPAPQLSDFWNAAPYQQAANAVRNGETSSVGMVNQAYQQALNNAIAQGKQASANAQQYVNNAQQSAKQAGAQEQANINTAMQGATPGSLLGNALAGTQATLNANNQRGVQTAQDLQNLVGANNTAFQQDIAASKANALQFLNAQVQGELNKIGLTQANDQTKAQEMFRQALNAYNTNNANGAAAVAKENLAAQNAYRTQVDNAAKQAMAYATQLAMSPHQQLMDTLNGPNMYDPNVVAGFNQAVNGVPGATDPSLRGAAKDLPMALARLDPTSPNYGAWKDMLQKYFNNQKQAASPQDIENYLAQLSGAGQR